MPKSLEWRKHISEAMKGKSYPLRYKPKVIKACEFCGKEIDIGRSSGGFRRGRNVRRFCNLSCWYNFIRASPENHPTYIGGSEPYYGPNWQQQRKLALRRDKFRCRSCNKSIRQIRLDIHHIIPRRNGDWEKTNELSNLITLCISCHKRASMNHAEYPLPLI